MYYCNQTPSRNDRALLLSGSVVCGHMIPLESRVWKAPDLEKNWNNLGETEKTAVSGSYSPGGD